MLTADYELYSDDSRYGYRNALREGFSDFGFKPSAFGQDERGEPGLWSGPRDLPLIYNRTHHMSMQYSPDEVFRFLWENRMALIINEDAYTKVEAVWPCYRVGSDGFFLRETVAVYSQQMKIMGGDLRKLNKELKKPADMPDRHEFRIYGGGTLIFDESGRLKYHVRKHILNPKRQNPRLEYLWAQGGMNSRKSFSALHLERILRHDVGATGGAEGFAASEGVDE